MKILIPFIGYIFIFLMFVVPFSLVNKVIKKEVGVGVVFLSMFACLTMAILIPYLLYILREKRHKKALSQWSMEMGFNYEEKFEPGSEFKVFKLFQHGPDWKTYNLRYGSQDGIYYRIFDYQYTIVRRKSTRVYEQTVFCARLNRTFLPPFILERERIYHKIFEKLTIERGIGFEDFPLFSHHYFLSSRDQKSVQALFTADILEYLQEKKLKCVLEGNGDNLLIYTLNKQISGKKMPVFFNRYREIVTLFEGKGTYIKIGN